MIAKSSTFFVIKTAMARYNNINDRNYGGKPYGCAKSTAEVGKKRLS
jgi:hypothetical protein